VCGPGNGATSRVARSLGLCSLAVSCGSTRSRAASSRGLRKQQMNQILLHYSACRERVKTCLSWRSRPRLRTTSFDHLLAGARLRKRLASTFPDKCSSARVSAMNPRAFVQFGLSLPLALG
jgi:hypothetical protein